MKYRKWRESNELRVGVTWHISFHRSMYFRNTWFSSLPLFRNLLSERHILSSKLTNAQMNGWWINMNGLQVQGLLCLLQRTLPVHSGRMILYFNVRRAVFFFLVSNFLSPWKRKNHLTVTLTPCPLCCEHNKEMRLMDTLCSISHSSMNAQPDFLQSWLKKKVVLSANCSRLSLHLQGKL